MIFFKNMKLGTKLILGFCMVLVVMLSALAFGFYGLSTNRSQFSSFRNIAEEDVLAGRIQANLLSSRVAFKNMMATGNEDQKKVFNDRFSIMNKFIEDLRQIVSDGERQNRIEYILDRTRQYGDDFKKVTDLSDKRKDIFYNLMAPRENEMMESLANIKYSLTNTKNSALIMYTGNSIEHLLSARLYAARYYDSRSEVDINAFKKALSDMAEDLKAMENAPGLNTSYYNLVYHDWNLYNNSFDELVDVSRTMDKIVSEMDTTGPEISNMIEQIKLSIIEEQDTYGPEIKSINNILMIGMAVAALIAVILSILISLGITRAISIPIQYITQTFKGISEGEADLHFRLKEGSKDEIGTASTYFNKFMDKLQVIMEDAEKHNWLKTGEAELSEAMGGEQDITALSSNIIHFLCTYLKAQIGAVYINYGQAGLKMAAGYAYKGKGDMVESVNAGEGLIGQCALKKGLIVVSDIPEDYIFISSGLGEAVPKNIILIPCLHEGEVKCILELGSFMKFSERETHFLETVSENIAVSINTAEARIKIKELLDKTIRQSEELQMQQEELIQNNEELEEQARILKESETILQAQQEELKVSNEELEQRTRQLEAQKRELNDKNEQVIKSSDEIKEKARALETANKYKSEFMANMSHELRTPLNSILVLSQLLANRYEYTPLSEKEREFARTIYSSGSDLLKLINDILDLSKVEAGRLDIVNECVNISEIVDFCEKTFLPIAGEKNLKFTVAVDSEVPETIITDSMRLQQIIKNLTANALKFTSQGSVKVMIHRPDGREYGEGTVESGSWLSISVNDTGVGIPKEKQKIIFEAFRQSDGTTSRKYGGTGLGLAISRELAKLLGGFIVLQSEEGIGSTFSLLIPERPGSEVENAPADIIKTPVFQEPGSKCTFETQEDSMISACTAMDEAAVTSLQAKTLLIIEDDKNFSGILSDLAEGRGYSCYLAYDGSTGLRMAEDYIPNAIILDIGLPDIDGWQVIEHLGGNEKTRNIPVHIISGIESIGGKGLSGNIAEYLKKPVSLEMIQDTLSKIESKTSNSFKKLLIIGNCGDEPFENFMAGRQTDIFKAQSGKEALNLFETGQFDCIVLDLELPDINGLELLSILKDKKAEDIPVIIYTSRNISEQQEDELNRYAKSIILRSPKSHERLIDEITLFLSGMDKKLSAQNSITEPKSVFKGSNDIGRGIKTDVSLSGKKILLVDDDMRNVFALTSVLEECGMKVIIARNGRECLEKLRTDKDIELILMDIMMPEMDGYEATGEIRKTESGKEIPIIALTAKAMKEDRDKCIKAGANDYLTKPVDIEKLMSLLRVWLYK